MESITGLINFLSEFWQLITGISVGVSGFWGYKWISIKKEQTSLTMLLDELERLQKKVVQNTARELNAAKDKADKDLILYHVKLHCKQCYEEVMKIMGYDEAEQNNQED